MRTIVSGSAKALSVSALICVACAGNAPAATTSFTTAGCSIWPVPAGIDSAVQIQAIGAAGGAGGATGGSGDGVSATLSGVSFGQTLDVCVDVGGGGVTGAGSPPAATGGGASGVSLGSTFASPVLVAGGGGGGGGSGLASAGGGGNAGLPAGVSGGSGGSTTGGAGGDNTTMTGGSGGAGNAGTGGTGSAFTPAGPGTGGSGASPMAEQGGGGGGGGYFGGGGGGGGHGAPGTNGGGGGGGGSDFCTNTATITGCAVSSGAGTGTVAGSTTGDARVVLTYTVASPPTVSIATPVNGAAYTRGQTVNSSFACSEGAGGSGLASCTDQNGHSSGAAIDTSTPGPHTLTVTATSRDGLTATSAVSYSVVAKATISSLSETNRTFAVAKGSTPLSARTARRHKQGTVFSFRLDQPATVKIAIQTTRPGRRVGRRCKPDSRRLRRKRRCTRTVTIVTLVRTGRTGINKVAFTGRIRGKALKPGRYQAVFTAIDAAGSSPPRRLRFTIVKR